MIGLNAISPSMKLTEKRGNPARLAFLILAILLLAVSPFVLLMSTGFSVGTWVEQTDYGAASGNTGTGGISILGQSCVATSSFVYCVGGQNSMGTDLSDVFYAQYLPN